MFHQTVNSSYTAMDLHKLSSHFHLCSVTFSNVDPLHYIVSGVQKNLLFSHNSFFGRTLVHGADSFSMMANIEQEDRPLFDTKIH